MADVDYSIVIPVYHNEGCLIPLMRSLQATVPTPNPHYGGEIIFVDDGSGDDSFRELKSIQAEFPALVTFIKLTRNFGQGDALLAGYNHSKGRCIVTISADGQEPPVRSATEVETPRSVREMPQKKWTWNRIPFVKVTGRVVTA